MMEIAPSGAYFLECEGSRRTVGVWAEPALELTRRRAAVTHTRTHLGIFCRREGYIFRSCTMQEHKVPRVRHVDMQAGSQV